MALVMDMRGVWRAGETPQTDWYPAMRAREKVENMVMKAGSGQRTPRPMMDARVAAMPREFFRVDWKGSTTTSFLASTYYF